MAAATPSTSGSRILRPRHRPDRGDGGHHRADCARSDCWPAPCFGGHHDTPTIERLAIRLPTDGGLLGHLINFRDQRTSSSITARTSWPLRCINARSAIDRE